jgi:hypothetical protein
MMKSEAFTQLSDRLVGGNPVKILKFGDLSGFPPAGCPIVHKTYSVIASEAKQSIDIQVHIFD